MDVGRLLEDAAYDCQFWHALLQQDEAPDIMARLAPALAKIASQDKSYMRAVVIASCASWPAPFHSEGQDPPWSPRWHQTLFKKRRAPLSSSATPGPAVTLPGLDDSDISLLGDRARRVKISRKTTPLALVGPLARGGEVITMLASPPSGAPLVPRREVAGLGPLGGELTALVLSHLSFRTKVTVVRGVASGMMKIMEDTVAWDPLQLARTDVKMFMRIITSEDGEAKFPSSLSSWERSYGGKSTGITNVKRLVVDLMEPEESHSGNDSEDSEEDAPSSPDKTLRGCTADPFRGLMMYLQFNDFNNLHELHITNIKPSSYRVTLEAFANMRKGMERFSMVELTHQTHQVPSGGTLVFKASLDAPPRSIDLKVASGKNRARARSACVRFDSTTTITESEALYLEEVTCVFKNGDEFFAPFLEDSEFGLFGTSSKLIRKYYKPVLAALSARFPRQLATAST